MIPCRCGNNAVFQGFPRLRGHEGPRLPRSEGTGSLEVFALEEQRHPQPLGIVVRVDQLRAADAFPEAVVGFPV